MYVDIKSSIAAVSCGKKTHQFLSLYKSKIWDVTYPDLPSHRKIPALLTASMVCAQLLWSLTLLHYLICCFLNMVGKDR